MEIQEIRQDTWAREAWAAGIAALAARIRAVFPPPATPAPAPTGDWEADLAAANAAEDAAAPAWEAWQAHLDQTLAQVLAPGTPARTALVSACTREAPARPGRPFTRDEFAVVGTVTGYMAQAREAVASLPRAAVEDVALAAVS